MPFFALPSFTVVNGSALCVHVTGCGSAIFQTHNSPLERKNIRIHCEFQGLVGFTLAFFPVVRAQLSSSCLHTQKKETNFGDHGVASVSSSLHVNMLPKAVDQQVCFCHPVPSPDCAAAFYLVVSWALLISPVSYAKKCTIVAPPRLIFTVVFRGACMPGLSQGATCIVDFHHLFDGGTRFASR